MSHDLFPVGKHYLSEKAKNPTLNIHPNWGCTDYQKRSNTTTEGSSAWYPTRAPALKTAWNNGQVPSWDAEKSRVSFYFSHLLVVNLVNSVSLWTSYCLFLKWGKHLPHKAVIRIKRTGFVTHSSQGLEQRGCSRDGNSLLPLNQQLAW